eukprot:COSAG04_NODE_20491_length_392_cov_1.061433_1_plen_58_part_01
MPKRTKEEKAAAKAERAAKRQRRLAALESPSEPALPEQRETPGLRPAGDAAGAAPPAQ